MTRRCAALALALASSVAATLSADQERGDFAKGFTVQPNEARPLFELVMPEEVYRTIARPDLGDLRVFSRDGRIVPHVVRRPGSRIGSGSPPLPLSFFPLRGKMEDTGVGTSLRIITDKRGLTVGMASSATAATEGERLIAYIIDLNGLPDMPDSLHVNWKSTADEGFAVTVDVESSEDLSRWQTLAKAVTLAELRSGGSSLVHNTIALPEFESRYLRIAWPEALRAVHLTDVLGFFPAKTLSPTRETLVVPGTPADARPAEFLFDTGGMRPVDRVRVVLEERNGVAEAALFSRPGLKSEWRQHFTGRFYSLERSGTRVQNEAVAVAQTTDRYWRLELESGQMKTARPPSLEIGWVPDLLTVVAQGDAPFTVAFGSATVEAADRTTEGVLRDIEGDQRSNLISSARVSMISTLGGESKLQPPPPPLPWRTWLLWSVLLGGVLLLGWMVRQLVS